MKRVIIIVEMCFSKTYIANILLCWLIRLKPQVSPTSTGSSSSWGKMEAVPWWVNKRMCCEAAAGFLHTADGVLVSHLMETWRTPDGHLTTFGTLVCGWDVSRSSCVCLCLISLIINSQTSDWVQLTVASLFSVKHRGGGRSEDDFTWAGRSRDGACGPSCLQMGCTVCIS